jgi:hypothetical protein
MFAADRRLFSLFLFLVGRENSEESIYQTKLFRASNQSKQGCDMQQNGRVDELANDTAQSRRGGRGVNKCKALQDRELRT